MLGRVRQLDEALKAAVGRHYPVYPVCDAAGVLTGLIRGEELFREICKAGGEGLIAKRADAASGVPEAIDPSR